MALYESELLSSWLFMPNGHTPTFATKLVFSGLLGLETWMAIVIDQCVSFILQI